MSAPLPSPPDDADKGSLKQHEVADAASLKQHDVADAAPGAEDERAVALRLARAADPGPALLSARGLAFVGYALVCCMCSGDTGFDGTIMSSVNSMTQFHAFFGFDPASGADKTGIVFGIYTVGQVCAFFPSAFFPDRVGRRWTMFAFNLLLVAGALIAGFSRNMPMLLFGRFLVGFGCTTAALAAKTYMSEVTSPWNRGRWMGLLNSFYYIGQLLASGISIPLGRMAGDYSWRIPLVLQCALGVVNVAFVLFLPESPRWLYSRGHTEQATQLLARLHSRDNDTASPLVQLELAEIEESISLAGADKRWWDFRPVFSTRPQRYRFGLGLVVACWGQLSGNGLITYFLPMLLKAAGITSPDRQRVLNFVNSVTSFAGALLGTSMVDFMGRRFLMLFAEVACAAGMFIVAGLLSDAGPQSKPRADAGISFIFLFMVFYSYGWTPLQALYPTECLPFEVRAKGLALVSWAQNLVSLINTFGLPSALAKIGWKTYLIFGCWDLVGVAVIYIFVVETKQLSLEELDEVFAAPNPKRASFALALQARQAAKERRRTGAA